MRYLSRPRGAYVLQDMKRSTAPHSEGPSLASMLTTQKYFKNDNEKKASGSVKAKTPMAPAFADSRRLDRNTADLQITSLLNTSDVTPPLLDFGVNSVGGRQKKIVQKENFHIPSILRDVTPDGSRGGGSYDSSNRVSPFPGSTRGLGSRSTPDRKHDFRFYKFNKTAQPSIQHQAPLALLIQN